MAAGFSYSTARAVREIWQAMRRVGHRELGMRLLALGFFAGVVTDLVVAYGGG